MFYSLGIWKLASALISQPTLLLGLSVSFDTVETRPGAKSATPAGWSRPDLERTRSSQHPYATILRSTTVLGCIGIGLPI